MERRYRVNMPAVAAEIIDGEAVIMNLKSGAYFSSRDTGCILWRWIEQGVPQTVMVQSLQEMFAAPPEVVTDEVEKFVARLLEYDLIRLLTPELMARMGPAPIPDAPAAAISAGSPFVAPILTAFTDMEDLLLLDPIHEVDEETGWPRPKGQ